MKMVHGIYTHHEKGPAGWMALPMPQIVKMLEADGHKLSDMEKTNGAHVMAGYCRLIDEAGLVEEGHRTEYEACRAIAERFPVNN